MIEQDDDFAALLRELERDMAGRGGKAPAVGDRVEGPVIAIQEDLVFIDLGGKVEGVIEPAALVDEAGELHLDIGDRIAATVTGIDGETGQVRLGSQHGRRLHDAAGLEQAFRDGLPVDGLVTGVIKGGLQVQVAGVKAFCPASQADLRFVEDLSTFVGEHLSFRITKLEAGRHTNLVVSRRALLEEERRVLAEQTRDRLEVGAVLEGRVSTLKDFGAFVDLGGIEGLVHVSELAHGRVRHPSEVLSIGQPVTVSVLRIEPAKGPKQSERIALSIRALARDPWQDAAERFPVGAQVGGRVTRTEPFGAFVELEPGLEGLVHISELDAGRRVNHPDEVVKAGERVAARVLGVDPGKRRIALSLAGATGERPGTVTNAPGTDGPEKAGADVGTFGELLRTRLSEGSD